MSKTHLSGGSVRQRLLLLIVTAAVVVGITAEVPQLPRTQQAYTRGHRT
jgi:hypothetical protein